MKELRKPCLPIEKGEDISQIIQDLKDTLATVNGYALAANQIGYNKQVAYIKSSQLYKGETIPEIILINPKIIEKSEPIKFEESCLSFPGLTVLTRRYRLITLQNKEIIELYGNLLAVIIQHECAHCNSKVMMDFAYRKFK